MSVKEVIRRYGNPIGKTIFDEGFKMPEYNPYISGQRLFIIKPPNFLSNLEYSEKVSKGIFASQYHNLWKDLINDPLIFIRHSYFKYVVRKAVFEAQMRGAYNKIDKENLMKRADDYLIDTVREMTIQNTSQTKIWNSAYNKFLAELKCYIRQYRSILV